MSSANDPTEIRPMAIRTRTRIHAPTSRTAREPTLPTQSYEWPTLDTDHDPEPLVEPATLDLEQTTLGDHLPVWASLPDPVPVTDEKAGDDTESADAPGEQLDLTFYERDARERIVELYDAGDGHRLDRIATIGGWELECVARELRHAGVLAAHDDPRTLAHFYHDADLDYSITKIAREAFGGAVCPETVRKRMEWYGIEREDRHAGTHYESLLRAAEGSAC